MGGIAGTAGGGPCGELGDGPIPGIPIGDGGGVSMPGSARKFIACRIDIAGAPAPGPPGDEAGGFPDGDFDGPLDGDFVGLGEVGLFIIGLCRGCGSRCDGSPIGVR
jgi:hypothetical protein